MPDIDATVVTAIIGVLGTVVVAYLSFAAKRTESKNNKDRDGVEALTSAVHEWRAIAERAENKAELAFREARAAKEAAERAEHDTIKLVEYLRQTWQGFINGTIPPPLPIPEKLSHLISYDDFPYEENRD